MASPINPTKGFPLPFQENTLPRELTSLQLYMLIKQAVIDGTVEAHRRGSTVKADLVAQELLGG